MRRRTESRHGHLLWPLLLGLTEPLGAQSGGLLPSPELAQALAELARPGETLLLGLRINGVAQPQTLRAVRVAEGLALPQPLWESLHLKLPALAPRLIDGEPHMVLDGRPDTSPDTRWHIEEASQTLVIEASASAFKRQQLSMESAAPRLTLPQQLGLFANYDLYWQRRSQGGGSSLDGLAELGALTARGDLNHLLLYRQQGDLLRLETRWTLDQPERMARLRLGDTVSQPGAWGRALRLGGLQWGTDFSLRPGFLSFPLPSLKGEAALPSTLDVYVNNSQRLQGRLQPGAFDLSELPIVTGQGEIRSVVRDLLGREQVVVLPYYVSPALLKPGLRAFSIELGRLREDYGLASNRYGAVLASLTERKGISERFTRELRAELMRAQQTLGATGIWLWPALGTGTLSLGLSRQRQADRGWMLGAGLDRQGRDWSGSLQLRRASAGFTQAGDTRDAAGSRWSVAAALGSAWGGTSMGLSYLQQGGRSGEAARPRLLSLSASRDLGGWGYLSLVALRDLGGSTALSLSWSHALGERGSASVNLLRSRSEGPNGRQDTQNLQLQVQQNPPFGRGLGYQLLTETGDQRRSLAQAVWQTDKADFSAGAAKLGRARELRAGVSGGLAWMDGELFASRRIDGGFAIVQVGDYAGVGVLHDNQPVARTDASGRAFIGSLRGYQSNRVGIDAADLPFDAQLDAVEVRLTPAARSAALISFPVQRSRAASFRLIDPQGRPLPPGSELRVEGGSRSFPVGLEGRAFVSGLAERSRVDARWPAGSCSLILTLPRELIEWPELGTLECKATP
ncbi:fimbria/pilus outer membrane usher protein [Paucibacter sp. O1-1]|nr:fimbria/pilus outer membrane usher protein [Paucibacter sp. O1-1]MDA3828422.1 fimbria/pilus outer membrane usher protein [Paucibacter sp. O1-1]